MRRRQARKAMNAYEKLVHFLQPTLFAMSLQAVLTFFTDGHVWHLENFCAELIKRLIYANEQAETAIEHILSEFDGKIETIPIFYCSGLAEKTLSKNVKVARQMLRVLHEVLVGYTWLDLDEEVLTRILSVYYHSIHPTPDDEYCYPPVRKTIELIIRAMFQNFTNVELIKSVSFQLLHKWLVSLNSPFADQTHVVVDY